MSNNFGDIAKLVIAGGALAHGIYKAGEGGAGQVNEGDEKSIFDNSSIPDYESINPEASDASDVPFIMPVYLI